jgi:hypothetical protein
LKWEGITSVNGENIDLSHKTLSQTQNLQETQLHRVLGALGRKWVSSKGERGGYYRGRRVEGTTNSFEKQQTSDTIYTTVQRM